MVALQKFPHFHQTLSHTFLTIHPDQKILLMYFFPNWQQVQTIQGLPWWLSGEESACQEGDVGSIPGLGRTPGKGNGNPLTPVFLPEKSHGQRSLVGYSPWGHKTVGHDSINNNRQLWKFQQGTINRKTQETLGDHCKLMITQESCWKVVKLQPC